MNIFTNLIDAAKAAGDNLVLAPIGSVPYELGINLQIALEPFREKETDVNAGEAPKTEGA